MKDYILGLLKSQGTTPWKFCKKHNICTQKLYRVLNQNQRITPKSDLELCKALDIERGTLYRMQSAKDLADLDY